MPPVNFGLASYKSADPGIAAARTINCFVEREPPDAKTQIATFGAPGLDVFATAGAGPVRGMHVMSDLLYAVSGASFYSVAADGTATAHGTVAGTGMVSMADNGTQVGVVNGAQGYMYTPGSTSFAQITDPDFFPTSTINFFDGYFVFPRDGTNQYFLSGLFDGLSYDGLDFASAEVASDFVVNCLSDHEQIYIFGERTIETWYDAGALDFPFQRYDGATIQRGCGAKLTPLQEDNTIWWLGDDLIFYRLNGTTPERVSTHAIEQEWQTYATVADAFTFSYTIWGHKLVNIVFPTALKSWVYDVASGAWHERESWNADNVSQGRWRGNCYARCYGLDLIGDAFSGKIGKLNFNSFTEFGNTMRLQVCGPHIHSDRKRVFMSRFELDLQAGVGLTTGQGSDPQAMLDWSDDGGFTFKTRQPWRTMGKIGQYLTRLRWLQMGQFRQRVLRLNITDPVRRTIVRAHVDLTQGT